MKALAETHGRNFELIRHFLARTFDSEMISTRGSWGTVAVSAFALAVPVGMLLLSTPRHHRSAAVEAGTLANLTLFLAITGLLALLAWQSLFPSRRDPVLAAMARRAVTAAVGAVFRAALAYVATYARHRRLLLEAQDMAAPRAIWRWSWLSLLAGEPRRLAILNFVAMVLSRSRL